MTVLRSDDTSDARAKAFDFCGFWSPCAISLYIGAGMIRPWTNNEPQCNNYVDNSTRGRLPTNSVSVYRRHRLRILRIPFFFFFISATQITPNQIVLLFYFLKRLIHAAAVFSRCEFNNTYTYTCTSPITIILRTIIKIRSLITGYNAQLNPITLIWKKCHE